MIHRFVSFSSCSKYPKVSIYRFQTLTFDFFSNLPKTLKNMVEDYFRNICVVLFKPQS